MTMTGRKNSGKCILNQWGICFMALIISGWALPSVAQAKEVTRSWKTNNVITKMQAIPIPESPGRMIGFFERQGNHQYENGDTAKQILRCTFDMVRGVGSFQGYTLATHKDGSTVLAKLEGVITKPKAGKLPTGHGTGKYLLGTGRFQGIQGNFTFKVSMLKPYIPGKSKGDALVEHTGTYTLPGK